MAIAEMPRSKEIDAIVRGLAPKVPGTALLAVGGYGREDLFPHSDIDLLLLANPAHGRLFAPFVRQLWDKGLRVSQSIHPAAECLTLTEGNLELTLSLIDRRFLAGDQSLFAEFDTGFRRFFDRKRNEIALGAAGLARERHSRYQNTIYHLEPNVKEGPGGLRDLHMLQWFQAAGHLGEAGSKLAALRTSLHQFFGRDSNTLTFEAQDTVGLSPESVMAQYFRAARKIQRAMHAWQEEQQARSSPVFARLRDRTAASSTPEFSVVHGQIHLRQTDAALHLSVFSVYELVARRGFRLSPEAGRRIHDTALHPICTWTQLEAILSLPHAGLALREMHDTGVLGRIFPSWAKIEGLAVRDYYHQYTVDEHTLVAIETVLCLRTEPAGLFSTLARETGHYPLLLLALLLHDTGKGQGEESHSEASVHSAAPELDAIGMPPEAQDTVLFLIRAHLEISRIMTTRDLTDAYTARYVAQLTGTKERLALLTLMTYGDINAVNPRALTPWRTTLLWQTYAATAQLPSLPAEPLPAPNGITLEHSGGVWRLAIAAADRPFLLASVAGTISSFGMDIVRAEAYSQSDHVACERFTFTDPFRTLELNPEEVEKLKATVARAAAGQEDVAKLLERRLRGSAARPGFNNGYHVEFDQSASATATLLTIATEDHPGLLYDLAQAISSNGCNIETVLINTEGRRAVDVFYVTALGQKLTAGKQDQLRSEILRQR
jgi:[protein-PII] uridylyltransferase